MKLKLTGVTPDFCFEFMVMQNLVQEFRETGFIFTKLYPHAVMEDEEKLISEECDITLENDDTVMIVDVTPVPTAEDIGKHIERLQRIRTNAYTHGDNRTFLGAIAGMTIKGGERDLALKNGIFVIEHDETAEGSTALVFEQEEYTEETFTITVPECHRLPAETVKCVNDLYLEDEQIAKILSEDVKPPPVTPALLVTKTVFPLPSQNKRPNRYACQG
jgi:hypothetical protein